MLKTLPNSENTCQLLEFQYIIEDKTYTPWLINIESNIKISTTGLVFNDALRLCMLHHIFNKIEERLVKIKAEQKK